MAVCCDPKAEVMPIKRTERLHEYQLRHHSIPVPPVNYRGQLVSKDSTHLKSVFDYTRTVPSQYIPCRGPHPDDVPAHCHWTASDVGKWLSHVGYSRYQHAFANLAIDGQKLSDLDPHGLRRMGIKKWEDCLGLADVISQLTSKRIQLDPEQYKYKIYPYYPALYLGQQQPIFSVNEVAHHAQRLSTHPTRDQVYRHIYNNAGDRFFYFDTKRESPLI